MVIEKTASEVESKKKSTLQRSLQQAQNWVYSENKTLPMNKETKSYESDPTNCVRASTAILERPWYVGPRENYCPIEQRRVIYQVACVPRVTCEVVSSTLSLEANVVAAKAHCCVLV